MQVRRHPSRFESVEFRILSLGLKLHAVPDTQMEDASKATAYSYVQVIFSAILGWFVFNEIPTVNTLFGALFITGGALINVWSPKRHKMR